MLGSLYEDLRSIAVSVVDSFVPPNKEIKNGAVAPLESGSCISSRSKYLFDGAGHIHIIPSGVFDSGNRILVPSSRAGSISAESRTKTDPDDEDWFTNFILLQKMTSALQPHEDLPEEALAITDSLALAYHRRIMRSVWATSKQSSSTVETTDQSCLLAACIERLGLTSDAAAPAVTGQFSKENQTELDGRERSTFFDRPGRHSLSSETEMLGEADELLLRQEEAEAPHWPNEDEEVMVNQGAGREPQLVEGDKGDGEPQKILDGQASTGSRRGSPKRTDSSPEQSKSEPGFFSAPAGALPTFASTSKELSPPANGQYTDGTAEKDQSPSPMQKVVLLPVDGRVSSVHRDGSLAESGRSLHTSSSSPSPLARRHSRRVRPADMWDLSEPISSGAVSPVQNRSPALKPTDLNQRTDSLRSSPHQGPSPEGAGAKAGLSFADIGIELRSITAKQKMHLKKYSPEEVVQLRDMVRRQYSLQFAGMLEKKSIVGVGSQLRLVRVGKFRLHYYNKPSDTSPRGTVDLLEDQCTLTTTDRGFVLSPEQGLRSHTFNMPRKPTSSKPRLEKGEEYCDDSKETVQWWSGRLTKMLRVCRLIQELGKTVCFEDSRLLELEPPRPAAARDPSVFGES